MFFSGVLLLTLLAIHVDNYRQPSSNPGQYEKHPNTKPWNRALHSPLPRILRTETVKDLKAEVQPDPLEKNPIQRTVSRNGEYVPGRSHS